MATPDEFEAFTAEDLDRLEAEDLPPKRLQRGTRDNRPARNDLLERALRARLHSAGFDVMFRGEDVYVDGDCVGSGLRAQFLRHRDHRDLIRDDDAFGRVMDRWFPLLIKRTAKQYLPKKIYLQHARPEPGFKIKRGLKEVGSMTSTSFANPAGERVVARFWESGEHWARATDLLLPPHQRPQRRPVIDVEQPEPRRGAAPTAPAPPTPTLPSHASSPPETVAPTRLELWPGDAPSQLTRLAQEASEQLRLHRVRADEFVVEVDCGNGRHVDLSPVRRDRASGRLDLPFAVRSAGAGELLGLIYLKSPNPVLAIRVIHQDADIELLEQWALALQVAASRYCGQSADDSAPGSEPPGFEPDPKTRERLRHWVGPHRARLPEGHHAGDDAVKNAEEVDIELPPGYTWRRGHLRGKGEVDGTLRYSWRPPAG